MLARTGAATVMAFREQRRRPLVLIVLVALPAYVITRSIAETLSTPKQVALPGGVVVTTTMRELHGAGMGGIVIAFAAALLGVFVMRSALQGDRRLVLAGYRPGEAVTARLAVLAAATTIVVAVSAIVTALNFTPANWAPLLLALVLLGLIYAGLGALAGALFDQLGATYFVLFLVITDIGVVQSPMFRERPGPWSWLLPGYGPSRLIYDGAFSAGFGAGWELLLSLGWLAAVSTAVYVVLRRVVGRGA